jgi:hypothetical protein
MTVHLPLCRPHKTGVGPGHPPFFQAGCPECERKLRLGLVTGKEGMPDCNWRAAPFIDHERLRAQKAARRRLVLGLVPVRVPPVRTT